VVGGAVAAWEDGFVARADGREIIEVRAESPVTDFVFALHAAGDMVVVGGNVAAGPGRGAFVRRLDAALQPVWTTVLSTVPFDAVTWVAQAPGGGGLLALGAISDGASGQDAVLFRLRADDGAPEMLGRVAGPDADWPTDAALAADGTIVLVGDTLGGLGTNPPRGSFDAFVAWLSADGAVERTELLGGPGDDHAAAVAVDACGTAVAVGYASGPVGGALHGGRRDAMLWAPRR